MNPNHMSHQNPHQPGGGPPSQDWESGPGPVRSHKTFDDRDRKGPIAAPVKSACTFCRSRKSRCDGNKPCAACVARGRTDDCIYTISRRGGKPKPKVDPTADLQLHLNKLFHLTEMPYLFRRPGGIDGNSNMPTFPADPYVVGGLKPPQEPWARTPQPLSPQQHFSSGNGQDYFNVQQIPSAGFNQPSDPSFGSSHGQPFHGGQHQPQQQQQQQHQQHQQQHNAAQQQARQVVQPPQQLQQSYGQSVAPNGFIPSGSTLPSNGLGHATAISQPWSSTAFAQPSRPSNHGSPSVLQSPPNSGGQRQLSAGPKSSHASPEQHPSPSNSTQSPSFKSGDGVPTVRSLLSEYYTYLYRFIPVLPDPRYLDILAGSMTLESPFVLALQCTLPLLRNEEQPLGALHGLSGRGINFGSAEKRDKVKDMISMYERKANEAIDYLTEKAETDANGEMILELIQTLCVMVVYEYGVGRAIKSRLKADQALGLAMGQGMHKLVPRNETSEQGRSAPSSFASPSSATHSLCRKGIPVPAVFEMRKRCWWIVWSLVLWTAYNTGRIPTIRADDPRVRSELPNASDPEVWKANVGSLQALLLVQDRVLALSQLAQTGKWEPYEPTARHNSASPKSKSSPGYSGSAHNSPYSFGALGPSPDRGSSTSSEEMPNKFHSLPTNASKKEIMESMFEIDDFLQEQIASIEKRGVVPASTSNGPADPNDLSRVEQEMEESLRIGAAVQLYTSSLTLHIGQAFQGASLFERKLCFLNSVKDNKDPSSQQTVCREPMPNAFYDELAGVATNSDSTTGILASFSRPNEPQDWASPNSSSSEAPKPADLYGHGPFLPRLSLQRCVHASKKLLDIAKRKHGQSVNPNPFNCCSFVLISFVLLMQALAVHGGFGGDEEEEYETGDAAMDTDHQEIDTQFDPSFGAQAQDLLRSGIGGHAAGGSSLDGFGDGNDGWNLSQGFNSAVNSPQSSSDQARQAQLRGIWMRVREARDTLADLGKHWEAVVPMADEVNLCLETSQLLLSS